MDNSNFYDEEFAKLKDSVEETFRRICIIKDKIGKEYNRENFKNKLFMDCLNAFDDQLTTIYDQEEAVLYLYYLIID